MQLISRAAGILRALEERPGHATLGEIASACGLPRATVQRIVNALHVEQFVTVDPDKGVRLGPALARIASAAFVDLATVAQPYLDRLAKDVGETVALTVLQNRSAVYVAQALPDRALQLASRVGTAIPLHSTANGKALLIGMSSGMLRTLIGSKPFRATPNTLVALDALISELAEAEREGFAYDREEQTEGISAIATPLLGTAGARYAVAVICLTPSFDSKLDRLKEGLMRCCGAIEIATGIRRSPIDGDAASSEPRRADKSANARQ